MTNLPVLSQTAQGRGCGPCSLCCDLFPVPELAKDGGSRCEFCSPPDGCAIHASRPDVCRSFDCAWLKGWEGEEFRPDRAGFFIAGVVRLRGRLGTVAYGLVDRADEALERLTAYARQTGHPVFFLLPPLPGDLFGGETVVEPDGRQHFTLAPQERFSWRNARPAGDSVL